jgi:HSP20 family protein
MSREKKSFFGKLMGSEEVPSQPVQINNQVDNSEEQDMEQNYNAPRVPAEQEEMLQDESSFVESSDEARSDSEEWPSEYEGELYIDMYQTKDNVIVKSTIAGVAPEDLDITIANDMLTIRGERKRVEKIDQGDYFFQECYWGGFSRSVILPVDVDSESIEAELKDGILTIILPKAAKAKTKKIKIKS